MNPSDAGFADHFSSRAAAYAKFRPHYPAELFDYLAGIAPSRQLAWDCACGSGQATVDLARRFERVIGTDASEAQVRSAQAAPNIEYRVALADRSGLDDNSADLVTVAQALHWFSVESFFAEAARVVRAKGILAVWTYAHSHTGGSEIDRVVEDFYSNVVGPYWPPERVLVEDQYRSIRFPQPELKAPKFEMRADWTLEQFLGYLSSWSATKNYVEARGENPIEALGQRLAAAWAEEKRTVRWPLTVRLWRKLT